MRGNIGRVKVAILLSSLSVSSASAVLAEEFYIGGRVRQGISLAIDEQNGGDPSIGPTQYLGQLDGTWKPNAAFSVDGSVWLRGDFMQDLNDGNYSQSAIQNFTAGPPFTTRFENNLTADGSGTLPQPFGGDGHSNRMLRDFEDVFRKFAVTYSDPKGRFSTQIGKFQRGWGQADGLRLLDLLYAQDLRQRAIFTDTEDLRINALTAAVDFNLDAMGLNAPFNVLGMKNTTLELLIIPEVRHSEFEINNPTPSSQTNGGLFGLPFPRLVDGPSGFGAPFLSANVITKDHEAFDTQEIAGRLKFDTLGGEATINGFYGWQDLPIIELTGANLIIDPTGSIAGGLNNERAPGMIVVPLPLSVATAAVHAPAGAFGPSSFGTQNGGFLPFIRGLAAGVPSDNPLSVVTGPGGPLAALPNCNNAPFVGAPNCSVNANFTADYTYRQKVVGFSFTRDMREMKFGPKDVSPVLRLEFSYEFDKPFQRASTMVPVAPGVFVPSGTGVGALAVPISQSLTRRDQHSLLVGVDYFLWLPFWERQRSSLFITSQFFNIHVNDARELLWQGPYSLTRVEKNWNYFTQTWSLPLMEDKLTLDGLLIWDIDKEGLAYRQRLEYAMMGGQLKPRLEWGYFSGDEEQGLLGTFKNSDYIELSLAYQF